MLNSLLNGLIGSAPSYDLVKRQDRTMREMALQNRFGPIYNIHELSDEQLSQAEASAAVVESSRLNRL